MGQFTLLLTLKEHLYPLSLRVQWHKNHSIWLRNEENIRKCSVIGPCLVMRSSSLPVGVLIHPRRSEKAEQEVQSGDGFVGDSFVGTHGRKNYSLHSKWQLEPLVDMTDGPSFPRLYSFGSPNDHHRSCNRPVFETQKLFGLTMCMCVRVSCPLLDRRDVTAVFFTRSLLASPHSSYCNEGCVTLSPYHLHKVS
jgi:hypothetical protein